jgi:CrcB protein
MIEWVFVASGGALGAVSRHGVNLAILNLMGSSLLGTFMANVTGSLVLGLLIGFWETRPEVPSEYRLFLAVGFLGSYTTFSTLAVATMQGIDTGDFGRALLNLGGSILVGMAAAFAGLVVGRSLA